MKPDRATSRSDFVGEHRTRSVRATGELGRRLGEVLTAGDFVALDGPLGAGKTALVRGIAAGLGIDDERLVSSPTFVLVQEYSCRVPLFHIDLYRMVHADAELPDLGLDEMLGEGVVVVEWADRADRALPLKRWDVRIEITGERSRKLSITAPAD